MRGQAPMSAIALSTTPALTDPHKNRPCLRRHGTVAL